MKKKLWMKMLVGVPGSGKSTWIAKHNFDWTNTVLLSTDAIIERIAAQHNQTYSEAFKSTIKSATKEMYANLELAVNTNMNIIWDQTNLTAKVRKEKLRLIPDTYKKVAVYFETPSPDELAIRLSNRPGKHIPEHVVKSMISQLETPFVTEGFDEVVFGSLIT